MGIGLRRWLRITGVPDAIIAARAVYRVLGIDLQGFASGDVLVSRCSFGSIYTPEVCGLMSSMDAGLLAGLTGGLRLTFSVRISEGHAICAARLVPAEAVTP
jgi:hypothetical protein